MFEKFRKAIAIRIYSNDQPGYQGYDDSAKECVRLYQYELQKIFDQIEKERFDQDKIILIFEKLGVAVEKKKGAK